MKKLICCSLLLAGIVSCGKKHRKVMYPNGQIEIDTEIDQNRIRNGKSIDYFKTGEVNGVSYFKNNLLHGINIRYYANGNVKIRDYFVNDTLHGLFQEYYESGNLKSQYIINKGTINGRIVEFYDTTGFIIKTATTYKNNMRNGESAYYDYDRKYITRFSYIKDSLMFYVDYNKDGSEKAAHFPLTQKEQKEELQNSTNIE